MKKTVEKEVKKDIIEDASSEIHLSSKLESHVNVDYTQKVLEVKNLRKYFYVGSGKDKFTVPAVDNVSFDIYKREVFGLVGESGCGKTTCGRTIIKLYSPTDGTVRLNGELVTAGFSGHRVHIKRLKEQAKHDILEYKERSKRIVERNKQLEHELIGLNHELEELEMKYSQDKSVIKSVISRYKEGLYNLKNNHSIVLEQVIYKYNLQKNHIIETGKNEQLTEFNNLKAILKTTFENKQSGLLDSAALTKEVQKQRLLDLKSEYEEDLKELEIEFAQKIVDGEEQKVDKAIIKQQLLELKQVRKKDTAEEKAKYKEKLAAFEKYDRNEVNEKLSELRAKYLVDSKEIKDKISQVKQAAQEDIAVIKETYNDDLTEEHQEAIAKIKADAKEKVADEKAMIAEIKSRNRSRESLELSRQMQMIFQDPISSLNPRMTVKEIIGEGLIIQKKHTKEEIDVMVKEALELVGLSADYATRYPHEFSGGQRQRIGIARALIMNPTFIIADEPISALDVSIRAQVINLLRDLREELGLTILFIAHDLSVVRFFCDRIAVMYYGKIVELAEAEELFANPMHPYTISLLSAIPQPDPDYEKGRTRINYDPRMHDYRFEKPKFREISEGHYVLASEAEFIEMSKKYEENNKPKKTNEKAKA